MGTGLLACFADNGTMNHLVTRPDQGLFFQPYDAESLAKGLLRAVEMVPMGAEAREEFRKRLADESRWLGYDRIIEKCMRLAEERLRSQSSCRTAASVFADDGLAQRSDRGGR
jgi:hypothetical protein